MALDRDGFTISLYAGPDVQDHRLSPDDPGSRLRGFYVGRAVRRRRLVSADADQHGRAQRHDRLHRPANGSLRAAIGWRFFEPFFVGPEAQVIWCADYQQLRLGAHITGLRINGIEWSAAGRVGC